MTAVAVSIVLGGWLVFEGLAATDSRRTWTTLCSAIPAGLLAAISTFMHNAATTGATLSLPYSLAAGPMYDASLAPFGLRNLDAILAAASAGIYGWGWPILVGGLAIFFHGQWREPPSQASSMLGGSLMMLLAATTWAFYGLAQKQLLAHLSSQAIMVCIYAACAVVFALGSSPAALLQLDAVTWGFLLFTSANTLIGYGTFSAALEHWEASRVSAVLALTPLGTLGSSVVASWLWPAVFDVEEIGAIALFGACAVVVGSLVVSLGDRRSPAG